MRIVEGTVVAANLHVEVAVASVCCLVIHEVCVVLANEFRNFVWSFLGRRQVGSSK